MVEQRPVKALVASSSLAPGANENERRLWKEKNENERNK